MNTGTARIVLIVALLVTGGLLLANGFDATNTAAVGAQPSGGTSPSPSPSDPTSTKTDPPPEAPETPKPAAAKDTPIAVFNGTDSLGLATSVMDRLSGDGYRVGQEPTDAPQKPVPKTAVYFLGGADAEQNESNATALADTYFKGAKVKELSADLGDLVDQGVQVVVVVGTNDAPAAG